MSERTVLAHKVIAVGGPPAFRPQVARALSTDPDAISWIPTVTAAEDVVAGSRDRFDLVVLSPVVKEDDAAGVARFVARHSPTTAVVVVRDHMTDGALPSLIRAGARDVVDLSIGHEDLRDSLRRALEWADGLRSADGGGAGDEAERHGDIVSIFSTKGGTGKTFLACNLAAAIASRTSERVALLDLDLHLGDVFAYFGAEPSRSLRDLVGLEEGPDREAVPALGTPLAGGVIGFGSPPDPGAEPIGSEAMGKILRALRASFDHTIVDATSEYSDHVLAAFDLSDIICLVTGLDVIGVRHMSVGMQTLENLGIPRSCFRVVLNRADSKVELSPGDIERVLGIRVDAMVPSSAHVPRSVNRARLLWLDEPRSPVSRSITAFADKIVNQSRSTPNALAHRRKKRVWRR
jgi:pilus assembly protein CpaE